MLTPVDSGRFKRDVRAAKRRGKDMAKLRIVIGLLIDGTSLPAAYSDHSLRGDWEGYRDLHIEPDWLLIYRVVENELRLARTGTHSDLFGK